MRNTTQRARIPANNQTSTDEQAVYVAALKLVRDELGGVIIAQATLVDEVDLGTWDGGDAA